MSEKEMDMKDFLKENGDDFVKVLTGENLDEGGIENNEEILNEGTRENEVDDNQGNNEATDNTNEGTDGENIEGEAGEQGEQDGETGEQNNNIENNGENIESDKQSQRIYKVKWRGEYKEIPESEVERYLSKGLEMDKWKMEHARDIELMNIIKSSPELREEFNRLVLGKVYGGETEQKQPKPENDIEVLDKKINEIKSKIANEEIVDGKALVEAMTTLQEYTEKKAMLIAQQQAQQVQVNVEMQNYAMKLQGLMNEIESNQEIKNKVENTLETIIDVNPSIQQVLTNDPVEAYNIISRIYERVVGDTNTAHQNRLSVGGDTKQATSNSQLSATQSKPKKNIPHTIAPSTTSKSNYEKEGVPDVFAMSKKEFKEYVNQRKELFAKALLGEI